MWQKGQPLPSSSWHLALWRNQGHSLTQVYLGYLGKAKKNDPSVWLNFLEPCKPRIPFAPLKAAKRGTSLAVQWLRLCTFYVGGEGSIHDQRTKIPHAVLPHPTPKSSKEKTKTKCRPSSLKSLIIQYSPIIKQIWTPVFSSGSITTNQSKL